MGIRSIQKLRIWISEGLYSNSQGDGFPLNELVSPNNLESGLFFLWILSTWTGGTVSYHTFKAHHSKASGSNPRAMADIHLIMPFANSNFSGSRPSLPKRNFRLLTVGAVGHPTGVFMVTACGKAV